MISEEQFETIWSTQRAALQRASLGSWMLVRAVKRVLPGLDEESIRHAVLDVIERAVREGEVKPRRTTRQAPATGRGTSLGDRVELREATLLRRVARASW